MEYKKIIAEQVSSAIRNQRLLPKKAMETWKFPFNLIAACIDKNGNIRQ